MHVYLGKLQNRNGQYAFINVEKGWKISLDEGQLARLQPVTDNMKETLLNEDYALSLSMGSLPETDEKVSYEKTGINWNN